MTAKLLPPAIQKQGERVASNREVETRRAENVGKVVGTRFPPLGVALPGELTPRLSSLLNKASTFGNLIVNNLDFQCEMNLVRIARKPPEQRLSLSFQLLQLFFGHGPFG
jgi:hypothetical protein